MDRLMVQVPDPKDFRGYFLDMKGLEGLPIETKIIVLRLSTQEIFVPNIFSPQNTALMEAQEAGQPVLCITLQKELVPFYSSEWVLEKYGPADKNVREYIEIIRNQIMKVQLQSSDVKPITPMTIEEAIEKLGQSGDTLGS